MLFNQALASTVLGKIVADKEIWIAARKVSQPLETFQATLTPSDRDFVGGLRGKTAFILECKKASPSKGLIRNDFSPSAIAKVYGKYASAISVLTDEKYFQGDFAFLPQVRKEVSVPVLCKDFIIDPYQIYLARHHQADAVLLMLSVLNDERYRELAAVAKSLNMGVLTEAISEEEINRAIELGAEVIGINNRDLRDLKIDLNRTRELAPLVPKDRVVICESGIYHHAQVKELAHYANGFLVGSSLMEEADLDMACRKLILGQNKVCGLTRAEDAKAAYAAGAVFGGLIFVEGSPRHVSVAQARAITEAAPLNFVGVFRNESKEMIQSLVETLQLSAVQLHGDESESYIKKLRSLIPGCQIWKAVAVTDVLPDLNFTADRVLLDSKVGNQSGGTGHAFDWSLLADLPKEKLMLAGGINPENIPEAIKVGCLGVDLNSGVESAPGIKDADKIQRAFIALRNY
ncbi:bifunctional indole-3-glycerol-phosphate synthase TrpC/phosphoribosylanthranilate isomerase TrpF [uncultured Tolumonas sp.]|uniref:bifunctional indole-3-glycerol-phosphate synthase TrpC/phosphoribosylanthranilate isomerase TrpF n=1 Tax=uncultured Tolumonas sp. TaxID=263765 RepID=UPI002A0A43C4|nr:bifunctional indole-3-glycerol-phosphate synthase TrpC/phosphoribosylanthranilate isomerase TrpF [uncultured Tolumonas sp.]